MQEASVVSSENKKVGAYTLLCKNMTSPTIKHDVGEDIEFPGSLIDAELVGEVPLPPDTILTLVTGDLESRIRVLSCHPLPGDSKFFHIRISGS